MTTDPEPAYAEHNGLWHVVEREEYPEVATICGQHFAATVYRFIFEPAPMCSHCRHARRLTA